MPILLFRANFSAAGNPSVWRDYTVVKRRFQLTFEQLRDAEGEVLGEALTEAVMQGLRKVVLHLGLPVAEWHLMMSVHSNSFQPAWESSLGNIPLEEWLTRAQRTQE